MKKFKVTVYQMGMPKTELIIEAVDFYIGGDYAIYNFKDTNGLTIAAFPVAITTIELIPF